jgi:hypothetical protein
LAREAVPERLTALPALAKEVDAGVVAVLVAPAVPELPFEPALVGVVPPARLEPIRNGAENTLGAVKLF